MNVPYTLKTGAAGAARLSLVERVYGDATRRLLGTLGVPSGASVADLGCGTGSTTRWFSAEVGPNGRVSAVDAAREQLELVIPDGDDGPGNVSLVHADATETGLDSGAYDVVHCRLLLCHVSDPLAVVREMAALARPGGLVVAFEIDLSGLYSLPRTESYERLRALSIANGRAHGKNYEIGTRLPAVFRSAGLSPLGLEFIHPVYLDGEEKRMWEYTASEGRTSCEEAGLITAAAFDALTEELAAVAKSESIAVAQPRLVACWARKTS